MRLTGIEQQQVGIEGWIREAFSEIPSRARGSGAGAARPRGPEFDPGVAIDRSLGRNRHGAVDDARDISAGEAGGIEVDRNRGAALRPDGVLAHDRRHALAAEVGDRERRGLGHGLSSDR